MAPIAISNQKPGFVPFSVRPLAIAGQAPRRLAQPTYRPAAYRPPMLLNQVPSPQMGRSFQSSEVPLSLTLGVAGTAAMILAGVVPTPAKEVATVVGLGLIAFGILNLFPETASAEAPTKPAGATPFPAATPDEFQLVTAKITKPSFNEVVDRGAFSYDYDVEVLWTNGSSKSVTVPYRIYVDEKPEPVTVAGVPLSTTIIPYRGVAYTGTIKLGPGESAVVPLEIDLKSSGFMAGGVVGVTMRVEKISSANQIFLADSKSFVVK